MRRNPSPRATPTAGRPAQRVGRLFAIALIAASFSLAGCASAPQADTAAPTQPDGHAAKPDDIQEVQEEAHVPPSGVWTNATYDLTVSGGSWDSGTFVAERRCITLDKTGGTGSHDDPIELLHAELKVTWDDPPGASTTLRVRMQSGFATQDVENVSPLDQSPLDYQLTEDIKVHARGSHWVYIDFCVDVPDDVLALGQIVHVEASFLTKAPINAEICCVSPPVA